MTDIIKPNYLHFDAAKSIISLDVSTSDFVQNPYHSYQFMHQNCPRFFWADYGFWCFAAYQDVNGLLRDRRFGREAPLSQIKTDRAHLSAFDGIERHSLLELEPPEHTKLRKLVNRAFVSRQIALLAPEIEAYAHQLIDGFEGQNEVDLLAAYATPLPLRIIARLVGIDAAYEPAMLRWSHAMVRLYTLKATHTEELAANQACHDFDALIRAMIALKRQLPDDSLLSKMVSQGAMSDAEIVSTTVLIMNAGHEATVHQIGNAVRTLLQPDMHSARAMDHDHRCDLVVEESLRFDAPLHMFTRYANEDVDFGNGCLIKQGEKIGLLLGAANHDPIAFENPTRFWPERPDQKSVSFGAGIHFCIGAPLARLEIGIALKVLFQRLPNLKLSQQSLYANTYHFHGLETLMIKPS